MAVQRLAGKYKAKRVLVEDSGTGTSLVQELRRGKVSGIAAVKPGHDKGSRMAVVSAKFEIGEVFLPRRAPWLAEFERELFAFPGAKHDDQCDSVSQALSDQRFPMIISDEALAAAERPYPWFLNPEGHGSRWAAAVSGSYSSRRPTTAVSGMDSTPANAKQPSPLRARSDGVTTRLP